MLTYNKNVAKNSEYDVELYVIYFGDTDIVALLIASLLSIALTKITKSPGGKTVEIMFLSVISLSCFL